MALIETEMWGCVLGITKSEFDKLVLESGPGSEANIDIFHALHILHRIWKDIPSSDVLSCWSVLIENQVSDDRYESHIEDQVSDDGYESQDDE